MTYEILITSQDGKAETFQVELSRSAESGKLCCTLNGEKVVDFDVQVPEKDILSLLLGGKSYEVLRDAAGAEARVVVGAQSFKYEARDSRSLGTRRTKAGASDGPRRITAPMPGKVVRIILQEGSAVAAGEGVVVIEAMKMQNELKSPKAGVVKKILVAEGATVNAGDALVVVE